MILEKTISVVIPAKNEAQAIGGVVAEVRLVLPNAQVLVVDDGSTDGTAVEARAAGADVISHPYSKGNGAAIKSGSRSASGEILIFMDGDGQHNPRDIPLLLEVMEQGFDMVVGARGAESQASWGRHVANRIYNWLSSKITGQNIKDLTSGFRTVNRALFMQCLYMLPNGFSYPTTSTMAFFRSGFSVGYVPIVAAKRVGKSHIHPLKDGIRFLLIIFKIATLYSPLKLFFPASLLLFLTGCGYYAYTYIELGRFTNMSALLFICSMLVFIMGLMSEQITTLMYMNNDEKKE